MKALLRAILINLLVIYTVDKFYPGFILEPGIKNLITAAILWHIINKIVRPIIKLLLLPINLITLNLFAWTIGIITIFILQTILGTIEIVTYDFPGLTASGFVIPSLHINIFFSYILTSLMLNGGVNSIKWLIRKDTDK
jgi:uncharacterized membrane protein YvlD (DUF360 family)